MTAEERIQGILDAAAPGWHDIPHPDGGGFLLPPNTPDHLVALVRGYCEPIPDATVSVPAAEEKGNG